MQTLWRRYGKKLLEVSCEFLLRLDHKYHANILCQCVLAVHPRRPRNEEDYGEGEGKENEVDFRLEKCSGEFYNFLANFLLIPVSTLQYYKIFAKIKTVNFKIESKLHPSQQFENNQYVILSFILVL